MTLKQLRVNKGLSQVELGNQVGLKQTTFQNEIRDNYNK